MGAQSPWGKIFYPKIKMKRLRLIFLTYGTLIAKSINEDLTDEEREQLRQSRSAILHLFLCILLTVAVTVMLLS